MGIQTVIEHIGGHFWSRYDILIKYKAALKYLNFWSENDDGEMIVVGERCDGDGGGSGGGGGVIGKVNFKTPMPPPPPPPPPLPRPLPPPPPPLPVEASLHTGVFRQHRWSFSSLLLKYSYSLSLSLFLSFSGPFFWSHCENRCRNAPFSTAAKKPVGLRPKSETAR